MTKENSRGLFHGATAMEQSPAVAPTSAGRDYLSTLTWDRRPRVNHWLAKYLGVRPTTNTNMIGQLWLVSAVARALRPGCPADGCLLLVGPKGCGKSHALSILGGSWYTQLNVDFESKNAALQICGAWIAEIPEFDEVEPQALKAFLSRRADTFRPPCSTQISNFKRECVFAGTAIHPPADVILGRRVWPVTVGPIDFYRLGRDRDQLWSEAVALYRSGARWWMLTEAN